ncbi:uncharacterized protein LOC141816615 [Curcuma longa]|uniref:uncharacterized protein LOC141816615 n=1 Tax=Curcuma longa TaxID=136217 RepID=UPI003D9E4559
MAGLVSLLRSIPLSPIASRALSLSGASPFLRLRPLVAAVLVGFSLRRNPVRSGLRCFSTRPTTSSLNNPSPNCSTACDFERWLVFRESPDPTRDDFIDGFVLDEPPDHSLMPDIIDSYIESLAEELGSEEEARISIYSVSTKHYCAFDYKVSKETSYKIKPLPKVRQVLPDSYLDVKNKDYGGEPFIDGYPPNYHNPMPPNTTVIPNYQNQTPPTATPPIYQVNSGGYQGGSFATPPIYQGGSSARPGSHTGYQGGSPSDYEGGGPPPTAYPGGYQGGAPAYQGGSPVGRQVFNQPFQGQGVTSGYPPPNSRYQGGSQNNQQGGEGYQGGSPVYPGRDLPGRDQ